MAKNKSEQNAQENRNVCSITAWLDQSHHLFQPVFYRKVILGNHKENFRKETLALQEVNLRLGGGRAHTVHRRKRYF